MCHFSVRRWPKKKTVFTQIILQLHLILFPALTYRGSFHNEQMSFLICTDFMFTVTWPAVLVLCFCLLAEFVCLFVCLVLPAKLVKLRQKWPCNFDSVSVSLWNTFRYKNSLNPMLDKSVETVKASPFAFFFSWAASSCNWWAWTSVIILPGSSLHWSLWGLTWLPKFHFIPYFTEWMHWGMLWGRIYRRKWTRDLMFKQSSW